MAETNLRQANAKANVEGILSEKNLEVKVDDGKARITGSLTIKTSDVNFITFGVNVNEKTNSGADNKCYAGMLTVMNDYKSIADVGEEAADRIRVSGDINLFRGRDGSDRIGYKSNFFNRVKANEEFNPHAEFTVEMYIAAITAEVDANGEETGRTCVKGWVPTYNGIEPISLVAEMDIGSQIETMFSVGQTVEFYGSIVNNRIETVREIPVAIGKPRVERKVTFKNDMLIEGASEAYEEGISAEKPYDAATIKAAIQERENKIKEAKSQQANNNRPSGMAKGRTLGF